MSVKIRLARLGKKSAPFFRIVAIDSRKKRDGKFIEDLGTYDPINGTLIKFHEDRINDWIAKGATPSLVVRRLQREYKKSEQS